MTPSPILVHFGRGTLLRQAWGDGHDRACLLSALAPETAAGGGWRACPAAVMPMWLAALTPAMDDLGSTAAWEPMVRRYADLASRWHVLDAAAWHRALHGALIAILEVARRHAPDEVGTVVDLLRRPVGSITTAEWLGAATAAKATAKAATATAEAAEAAEAATATAKAWAAWAAEAATATAKAWAAEATAEAAWTAAEAAKAEATAEAAKAEAAKAEAAAKAKAWDSMTTGILDAIESEIVAAEVAA